MNETPRTKKFADNELQRTGIRDRVYVGDCAKLERELAQAKEGLDVAYLAGAKDYKDKLAEAIDTIHDVWEKCGCEHPACKQCQRDKRTEEFLRNVKNRV